MKFKILNILIITILLLLLSCTRQEVSDQPEEIILVKIGDSSISYAEFVRRAEYTIRPVYARGNSNIDKKRVINSLIAEKMLAMEAGDTCKLAHNENFQKYIEGREQQAMRQWLYHKEGVEKVILDTSEVRDKYKVAGRKYNVQFISIPNEAAAVAIQDMLHQDGLGFEEIWNRLAGPQKIPEREINWDSPEAENIHNALFDESVRKDQVIGPVRANDEQFVLMKVKQYTNSIAITDNQQSQRLKDVRDKLTESSALKIYSKFASEIMSGKQLDFIPDAYFNLVGVMQPLYFQTLEDQKQQFLDKTFKRDSESADNDSLSNKLEAILEDPLFTYDGETWTVADFLAEAKRHPLVYRKKQMAKSEFAGQYRLAIADMLRDHELARVAYQRGYDKVSVVKRYTAMWRDALLALYQRDKYLARSVAIQTDSVRMIKIIQDHLDPYIDKLQSKYSDRIFVNVEKFNDIKLTRIDMMVTQKNVPFPIMVPSFPQLTTDHKLDYGQKMESNDSSE